jgi:trehalose-6-phosphatase
MTLIAVDFDKTLTSDSGDPYKTGDEQPDEKMVEFVQSLKEDYHYDIIVWTARPWKHAGHIAGLLTMWGVPYNGIKCDKGGAHVYIDDRAVNQNQPDWENRVYGLADHDNQDPNQHVLGEYEKRLEEQRRSSADA